MIVIFVMTNRVLRKEGAGVFLSNEQYVQVLMKISQD
jgi:hypothetical protein